MQRDEAAETEVGWALLRRAPVVQVATVQEGRVLLRTLHGVVWGGALCFHGGQRGEKRALLGARAVASAEEIVARIPSWMLEPERACPATTFFRSVQVEGPVEEVTDLDEKAAILQALMERFQPEGLHRPITAPDPMYTRSVAGTRVLRLRPEALTVRSKLGQGKPPAVRQKILRGLWQRGAPGDLAAIGVIQAAAPETPPLFALPDGLRADVAPDPEQTLPDILPMLAEAYWNVGVSGDRLAEAHRHSTAWVVLREADSGRAIATARAISDRAKWSWIYDVCVAPDRRGQGVGRALLEILRDHPMVRDTAMVLRTRDAQGFYAGLGFRDVADLPPRPYPVVQMMRVRPER